ncbi:MAG: DHHA1 domain-containing protein, partial [Butyricicoccus sp.]
KKKGAMALFGEKYGEFVRVVQAGDFSVEFCGGTHLDNTAKAGMFKIISEASVAAGVRRIEALTGRSVMNAMRNHDSLLANAAAVLKTSPAELISRANSVMEELKTASKNIAGLNDKLANMQLAELFNVSMDVGGVNVIATKLNTTPEIMRSMGDAAKEKWPNAVTVLSVVPAPDKIQLLCVVGKEAQEKGAHAGKIIKEVAKMCGGGGGGRPDSASAGGKKPEKLEEALEAVNNIVAAQLK